MRRPKITPTLLDRAIAYVDPARAVQRLRNRAVLELATGGAYTGASRGKRSLAAWSPRAESPNEAILGDLPAQRDRSRDLARNNPLATGALNTVITRVIGTGLSLQPAIDHVALGITREAAAAWQRNVKRRWEMWAERTWCDITAQQNLYGLQAQVMRGVLEAGDMFALLPLLDDRRRPSELAVKVVEGDRCRNPRGERERPQLAGGIEFDDQGRPVRYHFTREHPDSFYQGAGETDAIDAIGAASGRRNVLHVYDQRRPGQARGVPYLAPVIEPLKQLQRYTDAEIDAAVISSFFTVFMVGQDGETPDVLESAITGETSGSSDERMPRGSQAWNGELSSGLVIDVPKGDVKFADPTRPNVAFDPFVQAVLRQIGAALEIPFELLIKHFTSSYTAARGALLDFWLFVRSRREWMATMFCQPVYEEWLRIEIASGRIAAPGYFSNALARHAWSSASWVGDSMGVLDPQREAAAAEKYLSLGITTREKLCMQHDGSSWDDVHEQLVRENEARRAAGLGSAVQPVPPATPGERDDDDRE